MNPNPPMQDPHPTGMSRRRFLAQAGVGLAAASTLSRTLALGSAANSRIRLGLVGCGDRGQWILELFAAHGGYEVAAAADYFRDKVDEVAAKFHLPPARTFTGLECAQKMIAQGGLDAVALISPPYFRPAQARAAVEAGLHVYAAKPVAVDAPGARSIRTTGEAARRKGLVFLVDFQTRTNPFFIEALRRLHAGSMGDVCFGEATNHVGRLPIKAPPGTAEARLRNWVFEKALSGDIIVEQNIHVIDVMSWAMREAPPLRCTGTGGRRVRTDVGDNWDHFALVYEYADHVGVAFTSQQFGGHGAPEGYFNRMVGTRGVLSTAYGGEVMIFGDADAFYRGGATSGIYAEGAVANVAAFHNAVQAGNAANPTLEPSVTSTLAAILGRTAAYEGRTIGWSELDRAGPVVADLSGLQA